MRKFFVLSWVAWAAISAQSQSCVTPPSGLVSWWRGDGNANDSADGNNGTPVGNVGFVVGKVGASFSLNGTDGHISIPDSPALDALTNRITIELWMKASGTDVNPDWMSLVAKGNSSWRLQAVPGAKTLGFALTGTSFSEDLQGTRNVKDGQWHHVAAIYDGASAFLYVDGALDVSVAATGALAQNDDPLCIGANPKAFVVSCGCVQTGYFFSGLLDEVSLYNRALSSNEIAAIYAAGSHGKCYTPAPLKIASVNPLKAKVGDVVTISGTGFSGIASNNVVYFGGVKASVTGASSTSLAVTVPSGAAYAPVTVTVNNQTAYASMPFVQTYNGNGVVNSSSLAPRFALNSGSGSGNPSSTAIGDLNGDGKPDLVEANANDRRVWIYQNRSTNGTLAAASFAPAVILTNAVGANSVAVTLADINGDGRQDIIVSDAQNGQVSIFQNLIVPGANVAADSFGTRVDLPAGAGTQSSAVLDLDGDGLPDIVTANYTGNTISVFRAVISGGAISPSMFDSRVDIAAGPGPGWVALGDIDGDGKPDISVNNQGGSSFSVFRNISTNGVLQISSFAPKVDFALSGSCEMVALADVDGDGRLDVLSTGYLPNTLSIHRNTSTAGMITDASFAPRVDFGTGGRSHRVAIGDMDGDGKVDLVTSTELPDQLLIFKNISTAGSLTAGSLSAAIGFGAGWNPNALSVADLDGDGLPDVLGAAAYEQTISVYRNTASDVLRPFITAQPLNRTNFVGDAASFTVAATGTAPLIYQWSFNGTNITGATNATLALNNIQTTNAGNYQVTVSNLAGSTNSRTAVLTVRTLVCTAPPAGLVSWWRGEGDALDSAGGNYGTLKNGASFATGKVGQGFKLIGGANNTSGSAVEIPFNPSLVTSNYSVEAWINPASQVTNADQQSVIFGESYGCVQLIARPGTTGVRVAFQFGVTRSSFVGITSSTQIPIGQFSHVVGTWNGANLRIYVNGVLTGQLTASASRPAASGCPFYIGGFNSPAADTCQTLSQYFNGIIDEVSYYNRALSSNEIAAIYGAGGLGKCYSPAPPSITAQPQSRTNLVGDTATFSVSATGIAPLSYQWLFNGTNISGATNATLTLNNVQTTNAGNYRVSVSNLAGATNSAIAALTILTPVCTAPPSGLVSWWRGEGDASDSADGNSGVLAGGVVFASGKVGQAFSLNGASSYMYVSNSPTLNAISNQITVEVWIKAASTNNNPDWAGIVTKGAPWRIQAVPGAKTVAFTMTGTSYANDLIGTRNVNDGQWHHVAGVYDGTRTMLYIDGTLDVSAPATGAMVQNNQPVCIGATSGAYILNCACVGLGYFYNGLIDEAAIYSRALSSNEIAAIYGARGVGKCALPPNVVSQPQSKTVIEGDSVSFDVSVAGFSPFSYQWYFKGNPLVGETNKTLLIADAQQAQAGNYSVAVSNLAGITPSQDASLTVTAPVCTASPSGLVSWWSGEGDATDTMGKNHGELLNGAGFGFGKAGKAFKLNGGLFGTTSSAVQIPFSPSLVTSNYTVEAWINPASQVTNAEQQSVIFGESYGCVQMVARPGTTGVKVAFQFGTSPSTFYTVVSADEMPIGRFSHVVGIWNGTALQIYINGVLTGQLTTAAKPVASGCPFYIGGFNSPTADGCQTLSQYFNGLIDEVSYYNRALGSNEIAAIYGARGAGKCALPPTIVSVTPPSWYVNEGSTVNYQVAAFGSPALTYQWQFNGTDIFGATNTTLTFSNVVYAQAGNYAVTVSNLAGMVSSNVVLRVNRAPIADASATESPIISPNGSNAVCVLNGTRSGDPDNDPLTFAWFLVGEPAPFATNAVAVENLPAGTNELILSVSDGMATGSQNFQVEVITTSQAIDRLIALVKSGSGNTQPLIASLRAALAAIDRSQPATAINQLEAFINKVQAQVQPVDPALATELIADAQAIIDALNGGIPVLPTLVQITSLSKNTAGKPQLKIHGNKANRVYIIETSTNMIDWVPVGVANKRSDGDYEFDDTQSHDDGARFYRVISPK